MTKKELRYWRQAVMEANWAQAIGAQRDAFFDLWHGELIDEGRVAKLDVSTILDQYDFTADL